MRPIGSDRYAGTGAGNDTRPAAYSANGSGWKGVRIYWVASNSVLKSGLATVAPRRAGIKPKDTMHFMRVAAVGAVVRGRTRLTDAALSRFAAAAHGCSGRPKSKW